MSLQTILESAPGRFTPGNEPEIDLLRDILLGNAGTNNQRNMLIRVIKQNRPKKWAHNRINNIFGLPQIAQNIYVK